MRIAGGLVVIAAFAFALYGWGRAARRVLRADTTNWAATAATGMAALVFIGGVLNLTRLAHPWALAVVALVGLALAWMGQGKLEMSILSRVVLPGAVLIFTVATQVPPRAYNFHDDYQKYFVHPVRMLETGTVHGSPLNDIGLDTLGGQAFLDGFAVAFFPIQYISSVSVLGLFLCMLFAAQYKNILAALSVFVINPQYVNISALYTGSLLIMAAVEEASPAVLGLFYAALIAMKSTFVLFVAVHFVARRSIRSIGFAALFLAPWILVHAPHYVQLLHGFAGIAETGVRPQESFNLFSIGPLDYGSTPLAYTLTMIAVAVCGAMLWNTKRMMANACFAMLAAYLIMVYVSGPRNAGYQQAIRYFVPFAIGIAPAAFGSLVLKKKWIPYALAGLPLILFLPSLRDRMEQAVHSGSVLAFSWLAPTPEYLDYNAQVLYGDMRSRVEAAQAKVPKGDQMVAWINAPFYLDFRRNRVADIEPGAGLIAPWAEIPSGARYFIFEYGGYANVEDESYLDGMAEGPDFMRRVDAARLGMSRRLTALMRNSPEKLYDDGSIAVFSSAAWYPQP